MKSKNLFILLFLFLISFKLVYALTPLEDSSIKSNNLTNVGATYNNGDQNFQFDGLNDFLYPGTCTEDPYLCSQNISMSCWVKTNSNTTSQMVCIDLNSRLHVGIQDYDSAVSCSAFPGQVCAMYYNGSNFKIIDSGATRVAANTWTHIAITKQYPGNISLFINGQLVSTATSDAVVYATARNNTIGAYSASYARSWFNGSMDDLKIWNATITSSDILQDYQDRYALPQSNKLIGNYRFDNCTTPIDNLYINSNTTLCSGNWYLNDTASDGIFIWNSSNTILNGNGAVIIGNRTGYGLMLSSGVYRTNIQVYNLNISSFDLCFNFNRMNRTQIFNNSATNCKSNGFFATKVENTLFQDNYAFNVTGGSLPHGMYLSQNANDTVNNITINRLTSNSNTNNGLTINVASFSRVKGVKVFNSSFSSNGGQGIDDYGCDSCSYIDNTFISNGAGIRLSHDVGGELSSSLNNNITRNTFTSNTNDYFITWGAKNSTIYANTYTSGIIKVNIRDNASSSLLFTTFIESKPIFIYYDNSANTVTKNATVNQTSNNTLQTVTINNNNVSFLNLSSPYNDIQNQSGILAYSQTSYSKTLNQNELLEVGNFSTCVVPTENVSYSGVVAFCPGTYTMNYGIKIGIGGANITCDGTIIQGTNTSNSRGIDFNTRNNVNIKGCTVKDFTNNIFTSTSSGYSISNTTLLWGVNGINGFGSSGIIENNTLNMSSIYIDGGHNNIFRNNNIYCNNNCSISTTYAAQIRNSNNTQWLNNTIINARLGLVLYGKDVNTSITQSLFKDNDIGLRITDTQGDVNVKYNNFRNNSGDYDNYNLDIQIINSTGKVNINFNNLTDSVDTSIQAQETDNLNISSNTFDIVCITNRSNYKGNPQNEPCIAISLKQRFKTWCYVSGCDANISIIDYSNITVRNNTFDNDTSVFLAIQNFKSGLDLNIPPYNLSSFKLSDGNVGDRLDLYINAEWNELRSNNQRYNVTTRSNNFYEGISITTNYTYYAINRTNKMFWAWTSSSGTLRIYNLTTPYNDVKNYSGNLIGQNSKEYNITLVANQQIEVGDFVTDSNCIYLGSGSWYIPGGCNITINTNVLGNPVIFNGSGIINVYANITNFSSVTAQNGPLAVNIYASQGGKLG